MKHVIVISALFILIGCSAIKRDSNLYMPNILSVDLLRANAGALTGSKVTVYGYLDAVKNGEDNEFLLLSEKEHSAYRNSDKKIIGVVIQTWGSSNMDICVGKHVKVSGIYTVEEIANPNAFYFDSVDAEIIQNMSDGKLCGANNLE